MKQSISYIVQDRHVNQALDSIAKSNELFFDTESTDLNPRQGRIRLTQITNRSGDCYLFDHFRLKDNIIDKISNVLQGKTVVAHKAVHDRQWYHDVKMDCTLTLAKVGDCGDFLDKDYSLRGLVFRFLNKFLSKEEQTSNWSSIDLTTKQLQYAAKDVFVLVDLYDRLVEHVKQAGQWRVYLLERALIDVNLEMNTSGIKIDTKALSEAVTVGKQKLNKAYDDVIDIAKDRAPRSVAQRDLFSGFYINLSSPKQVLSMLQEAQVKDSNGFTLSSTNKNALKDAEDDLATAILEYRKYSIRLSYADSWKTLLWKGKVYPEFDPLKRTGRYGCSKPNFQQVAKELEWRRCFVPDDGYEFTVADYSQIELRVAAEIMNIGPMIEAYDKGYDLHSMAAADEVGISYEQFMFDLEGGDKELASTRKLQRFKAKAKNFGFIYGMGWRTFKVYAKTNYGISYTDDEAKSARASFMRTWIGVESYHNNCVKQCEQAGNYVFTSFGRKRYVPEPSPTICSNTPVQGTAIDGLKLALVEMYEKFKGTGIVIKAVVHDEVIIQNTKEQRQFVHDTVKDCMERTMSYLVKKVPIVVEPGHGLSWGEAK